MQILVPEGEVRLTAVRELVMNAFPGEGLKVANLILEVSGTSEAEQIFGYVQEHCEENFLPVLDAASGDWVLVSGYSRVLTGSEVSDFERHGVYWNPRTQLAYKIDFARLEVVDRFAAALSPNVLRFRLQDALNTRFHVFYPPTSRPLMMALTSRNFSDAHNFTAGCVLNRFECRAQETSGSLALETAESEIRALHYEDAVACLTISLRLPGRPPKDAVEEVAGFMHSCDSARPFDPEEISDKCGEALKALRRQLPVHKQRFDWNIHRVAMLLHNHN